MNIDNVLKIISSHYGIDYIELENLINSKTIKYYNNTENIKNNKNNTIILPYHGVINEYNCKGLVYNHGLYTQCTVKYKGVCTKCIKNKYGTIENRKNYPIGKYITPDGKIELDYNILINRLKYNTDDVIKEFNLNNIDIKNFNIQAINNNGEKKGRGRPKKIKECIQEDNTIEVIKYLYNEISYLKTNDNILLNPVTYDIVGIVSSLGKVDIW